MAEQDAIPMVSSSDVARAVDWLTNAFGFVERDERYTDEDGRVTHAEIERDGAVVMIGWPGPDYLDPSAHAAACEPARRWLDTPWVIDGVLVTVDDVDAHHAKAVEAGATILRPPEDSPPGRLYSAADPDGHRWMFLEPRSG